MTVSVEERPGRPGGSDRRPGNRAALAVLLGLPVLVVLVVIAGFTHPWNAGGGLAAGEYHDEYSIVLSTDSTDDPGRCVEVTVAGTMTATYNSPAWSLGGPGWTSPQLSGTSATVETSDACGTEGVPTPVDSVRVTQFWASRTCDEPHRGTWQESTPSQACDQDLVSGAGAVSDSPGSTFTSRTDAPLGWRGTTYGDAICVDGLVSGEVIADGRTQAFSFDDYQVCLDPETASQD